MPVAVSAARDDNEYMSPVRWIADQKAWERVAEQLVQQPELAVDTESNSLHAYRERVCLVQIAASDETFLLDPLAIKDLSSLGQLLAASNIVKVLHGSDYDLRSLDREYGYRVQPLFDTGVAARFLGVPSPNLASVLETFLGVSIPKSRKLQRSNWGLRPLSTLAMEYAASDVRYLVRLSHELRQRLAAVSRLEWVLEECWRLEQVRYSPPDFQKDAFLLIKSSAQLNPGELAVLEELVAFREAEARLLDWPPFRVLSNETLLFLAQRSDTPLPRVPGLSSSRMAQAGERLQAAIDRGRSGPGLHRPRMPKRDNPWTPEAQALLRRLKKWRTERGAMLGLDPALLWPAASLERLALQPNQWETELIPLRPPLLMEDAGGIWQRRHPRGSPRGGDVAEPSPSEDTGETTEVREWQRLEFAQELKEIFLQRPA